MLKRCYGCMTTYESTNGICPECGYVEGTTPENPQHLVPGVLLNNRFIVGKVVGYGGFGVTYLGWDKLLAQKVAIKEYLPSEFSTRVPGKTCISIYEGDKREQFISGKQMFVEEAKKLAKFTDCQGIVKVFDSFVENDTAYIVMEYVDGVTLEEYFIDNNVFDPEEAVLMMLPVIESLKKVHESNVIHRDIAPNNIMISKTGDVKLIDFGAARFASATHTKSMTVMIKPGYSPEEQYMSRGDQGPYTDVYALGATLYRMITGVVPPDAMERRAKFQGEGKDILEPISKYNKNISKNLENAIMNAMNVEIATRTKDMDTLLYELTTEKPVARRNGKIKLIDLYKWPRWLKVTIPAAMVFILTISTLFGMGFIGFNKHLVEEVYIPEGMVKVPWVVNKMEQDATRMLEGTKLIMTATAGEYSDEIAAGMVMAQETSAGSTVLENSRIYVTLSRGIEMKTIPSSVALYTEAVIVKQVLEDLGFVVVLNEETEYSTIPKGLLTKMVLEDGTIVEANDDIAKGKTIILTMSLGLDPSLTIENQVIKVPDFMNKSKVEAYTLAGDSVRIEIQDKYKAGVDTGIIWYQSVDAGTEMENTETIILYASVSNKVKVPEVIGINYEKAISELQAVGLSYKIERREHENYAKDMVFEQSVTQGTMLEKGTEITLIVSDGPSKQDVPDVSGMKAEDAKNKLSSLGFAVSINYADSSTVAKGNVISQNIVGAKIAIKGDVIVLTVSNHEETQVQKPKPQWSEWTTDTALLSNSAYEYETMTETQWRFKDRSTTTSNQSSMSGWILYDTQWAWSDYGAWSDWSTNAVSNSDECNVETKTQYRYRDREVLHTNSTQSSMPGWTHHETRWEWGPYGQETTQVLTAPNADAEVATRTETITNTVTQYRGYSLAYKRKDTGEERYRSSLGAGTDSSYTLNRTIEFAPVAYDSKMFDGLTKSNKKYNEIVSPWTTTPSVTVSGCYAQYKMDNGGYYWAVQERQVTETTIIKYYKIRYKQYRYFFWKYSDYGNWSNWNDTAYTASDLRQVENRPIYRYQTRSKLYTYYYEKYSDWSDWSTTQPNAQTDRIIEDKNVTYYRYRLK